MSTLYKSEPLDFQLGFPTDEEDAQCRLISSRHKFSSQEVTIINGYFPQGESRDHPKKFPYKEKFFKDLMIYLNENFSPEDNIIILGDLNISPEDIDIGLEKTIEKDGLQRENVVFLPEEREWLEKIKTWGFFDSYRKFFPDSNDKFSWFDYRSRGLMIIQKEA